MSKNVTLKLTDERNVIVAHTGNSHFPVKLTFNHEGGYSSVLLYPHEIERLRDLFVEAAPLTSSLSRTVTTE